MQPPSRVNEGTATALDIWLAMQAIAKKGQAVAEEVEAAEADDNDADLIGDVDLECAPLGSTACSARVSIGVDLSHCPLSPLSDLCC